MSYADCTPGREPRSVAASKSLYSLGYAPGAIYRREIKLFPWFTEAGKIMSRRQSAKRDDRSPSFVYMYIYRGLKRHRLHVSIGYCFSTGYEPPAATKLLSVASGRVEVERWAFGW